MEVSRGSSVLDGLPENPVRAPNSPGRTPGSLLALSQDKQVTAT
jgi:hypothetical protein